MRTIISRIDTARIHPLNDLPVNPAGSYVLYWMQQSQRAEWNHALEYAIERANALERPVYTVFALADRYPEANERHYVFMLEGLRETFAALEQRGVAAFMQIGTPPIVVAQAASRAALLVCDQGYLRHQATWRAEVAQAVACEVLEVESDVMVPVEEASDHAEYMARTLRPKIQRRQEEFLKPVPVIRLHQAAVPPGAPCPLGKGEKGQPWLRPGVDEITVRDLLGRLRIDRSVGSVAYFKGGLSGAKARLRRFIRHSLDHYAVHANQPHTDDVSELSPYLHFGQISPLYVAQAIQRAQAPEEGPQAFLEQLLVRRELAVNYVWFTPAYDQLEGLPDWARRSLQKHARDERPHTYALCRLEQGETHDPYWNAAMEEMRRTGFMHNYMRMYWGKKVLEWSRTPEEAFEHLVRLNNKYFLDGRDANSYAGVAWIFGRHDQAWAERPVFGKVRYMNAAGLKRKCNMPAYLEKVQRRPPCRVAGPSQGLL